MPFVELTIELSATCRKLQATAITNPGAGSDDNGTVPQPRTGPDLNRSGDSWSYAPRDCSRRLRACPFSLPSRRYRHASTLSCPETTLLFHPFAPRSKTDMILPETCPEQARNRSGSQRAWVARAASGGGKRVSCPEPVGSGLTGVTTSAGSPYPPGR